MRCLRPNQMRWVICAFNRLLDVKTSSVDGDIVVSFFPNSVGMLSKGQTSVESFFRVSPGAGAVPEGHYKHYVCLSVAHFEHLEGKNKNTGGSFYYWWKEEKHPKPMELEWSCQLQRHQRRLTICRAVESRRVGIASSTCPGTVSLDGGLT